MTGNHIVHIKSHFIPLFHSLRLSRCFPLRNENRHFGRLYCGHGPVVESADKKIKYYINHRQEREDQIVETLTAARNQQLSSWQVGMMNKEVHERFKRGKMLRV